MNFTIESIREHVGSSAFSKGREYYVQKKVKSLEIDGDTVVGTVQGTRSTPYETEFTVEDGEIVNSDCSCPVGFACKHVAALALQTLMQSALHPAAKLNPSVISPQKQPSWMQTIASLLKEQQISKNEQFQLQILFNIELDYPYDYFARYLRSSHRPVKQQKPHMNLTMRPRIHDPETGNFSASQISWERSYNYIIYWNGKQGILPQKQFTYLQLLKAGLSDRYARGWTKIDDEKTGYVWQILKEHESYGVTLLGGTKGQIPLILSDQTIDAILAVNENEKGLVIEKKVLCGEQDITNEQIAFAGNPPGFAVIVDRQKYELHPVSVKSSTAASFDEKIVIPKTDIPILQEKFLPELAKQYPLQTNTEKIKLPETISLDPTITVKRNKKMAISVRFGFSYKNQMFPFDQMPDVISESGLSYIPDKQSAQDSRQTLVNLLSNNPVFGKLSQEVMLEDINTARFVAEIIPKLQAAIPNLVINLPEDLPDFYFDTSDADINISVDEDLNEHDWFDLGITVSIGQGKVAFQELFSAMVEDQEYLLLDSGRYFPLNTPQFARLKELIAEAKSLHDKTGDGLSISRFQVGLWDELKNLGVVTAQTKRWQETMQGLLNSKGVEMQKASKTLNATLRQYQIEGFSWLQFLHEFQLGGILADDMGLGKTIQTIAFMAANTQSKKPFLVIAPTSVVENWDSELERFCPSLKRVVLRAGDRIKQLKAIPKSDVVIMSYALLVRDFEKLKDQAFNTIILDEAQMVKNYRSKAYGLVRRLKAESKIALTGTPLENNLMELWSIFSIVSPGLLPSPEKFKQLYRTPIEKQQSKEILVKLKSRIRPFILRRQKAVVEKQLPPKNEQVMLLPLNNEHRHIYDLHLQQERKRVLGLLNDGGLQSHRFEILKSLTRMRQLCLHPELVDKNYHNVPVTKLEALIEYLDEIVAEKHRVLIFSQFTSFLAKVKTVLDKAHYPYLYLAGETKNRGEFLKEFQRNENIPIFLISLKAGGFGLNLTAADYCILLDPWWNPAVEQQAIDRTHRIGQTKPVFVYKLIMKDTIEEKVLKLQEKKQKLFKNIMDDESFFSAAVTEEDIKNIFI